jgi:hypothetical protein
MVNIPEQNFETVTHAEKVGDLVPAISVGSRTMTINKHAVALIGVEAHAVAKESGGKKVCLRIEYSRVDNALKVTPDNDGFFFHSSDAHRRSYSLGTPRGLERMGLQKGKYIAFPGSTNIFVLRSRKLN